MSIFDNLFKKELTVNEGVNRSKMEKNTIVVDIRPKEEYKKGHVPGVINIPYNKLQLFENRVRDKETTVYLVGSYAHEPKKVMSELKKMGYTNLVPSGKMEEHHGLLTKN